MNQDTHPMKYLPLIGVAIMVVFGGAALAAPSARKARCEPANERGKPYCKEASHVVRT